MIRPLSIVRYEQMYLAAFALALVVTALSWGDTVKTFAANPLLAQMTWVLPALTVFGFAVRLLLWYFTARRPSVVAKWVVVVFAALSALGIVTGMYALATARAGAVTTIVSLISSALYVAATVYLFRPDAKTWFGEETPA